jgi:hypothetical protein
MVEAVIIILTLILVGITITKLESVDFEMHERLGGNSVLYWPPSGIKFIYYICSGKLFSPFKDFPVKLFPYILFFEFWAFLILTIKTRVL